MRSVSMNIFFDEKIFIWKSCSILFSSIFMRRKYWKYEIFMLPVVDEYSRVWMSSSLIGFFSMMIACLCVRVCINSTIFVWLKFFGRCMSKITSENFIDILNLPAPLHELFLIRFWFKSLYKCRPYSDFPPLCDNRSRLLQQFNCTKIYIQRAYFNK